MEQGFELCGIGTIFTLIFNYAKDTLTLLYHTFGYDMRILQWLMLVAQLAPIIYGSIGAYALKLRLSHS